MKQDISIRCPDCNARLGIDLHQPGCTFTERLLKINAGTPYGKTVKVPR